MLSCCARLLGGLILLCLLAVPAVAAQFERANLEVIRQSGGSIMFEVDVAATLKQRQQGLMYRSNLPWKQGMFMDFETDQVMNMWMKNTSIPLDMLFADADGMIFLIVEGTEPYSLDVISSIQPGRYVLEVLAGSARRFGIKPGDIIVLHQRRQ